MNDPLEEMYVQTIMFENELVRKREELETARLEIKRLNAVLWGQGIQSNEETQMQWLEKEKEIQAAAEKKFKDQIIKNERIIDELKYQLEKEKESRLSTERDFKNQLNQKEYETNQIIVETSQQVEIERKARLSAEQTIIEMRKKERKLSTEKDTENEEIIDDLMKLLDKERANRTSAEQLAEQNENEIQQLKREMILLTTAEERRVKTPAEREIAVRMNSAELGNQNILCSSVLMLKGNKNRNSDSIYIYNSNKVSWQTCRQKLPSQLHSHGVAILNRKIYIFGGENGSKDILYFCYKLEENGEWTKLANMNEERTGISRSSVVFHSEIWAIGGFDGMNYLKTVEKYNPTLNKWIQMPETVVARQTSSVSVIAGKIYVSGGWDVHGNIRSVEVYDPAKNRWEIFCDMPLELTLHCSVVDGTNLIIIGGIKSDGRPSDEVWKIDVFDPKKEWIKMPSLNHGRYNHGAARVSNGIVTFGGSINKKTRIDSVELFNGGLWKEVTRIPDLFGYFSFVPLPRDTEEQLLQWMC